MHKIRVHQLAKELGTTSADVIEQLRSLGVEVKGPSSLLEPQVALQVRSTHAAQSAKADKKGDKKRRLRELEQENSRLKRLLADAQLEKAALREALAASRNRSVR